MNMIASAIPAVAPPSGDGLPASPSAAKASAGSRSRSAFSSVLRSVQRADGASPRRQEPGESSSDRRARVGRREADSGKVDGSSTEAARAGRRAGESNSDRGQESQKTDGDFSSEDQRETSLTRNESDLSSSGQFVGVTPQEKTADSRVNETMLPALPEETASGQVVMAMAGAEGQTISGATLQGPAPARQVFDDSADQETLGTAASVTHTHGSAVSGTSETAQPRAGGQRMSLRADEGMSDDQGQADQKAPPFLQASGNDASVSEQPDSTTKSSAAVGSSSIIARSEGGVGPLAVRPEPAAWEAPKLSDQPGPVESAGAQHPLVNDLGLQGPSIRNQEEGKPAIGERHQAGPASESAAAQREASLPAGDRPSDGFLSELQADHRLRVDVRAQEPAMSGAGMAETVAQRPETAAAIGQPASPASSELDRHGGAAPAASQISGRPHAMDSSLPVMSRSVVLEVAQPDLGRVNIRVALANDFVHTHLSSDRLEVGQYLLGGQDRLQSAFQTNGLEMGQFRVDIDRQSAGRSFQHGQSQDQGRMWQQEPTRSEQNHGASEPRAQHAMGYAGKLNLVA